MRISDWSSDVCSSDLELVALARHLKDFLLREAERVALKLLFQRLEPLDRTRNRLPVGEHAAQPAVVDEVLAGAAGRLGDRVLRLTLGADEQPLAAMGRRLAPAIPRPGTQRKPLRKTRDEHP